MLRDASEKFKGNPYIYEKKGKKYIAKTFNEVFKDSGNLALSLLKNQVNKNDKIEIIKAVGGG